MADKFVMLVEGPDDYHVMQHLLTVHGVDKQIQYRLEGHRPAADTGDKIIFKAREGVQNVLDYLTLQLRIIGDLQCIGVIVDADLDSAARWQSLRDILVKAGYPKVPKKPGAGGMIFEHEEKPRVGVWIMPNNLLPGKIEDFIALLMPPDDALWKHAELSVQQIPENERRFTESALIKAHLHTWLAWQEVPGLPMGQAITRRYLDANAPEAVQIVDWLRRLFELASSPSNPIPPL